MKAEKVLQRRAFFGGGLLKTPTRAGNVVAPAREYRKDSLPRRKEKEAAQVPDTARDDVITAHQVTVQPANRIMQKSAGMIHRPRKNNRVIEAIR